ncbi:hypothetical protein [Paenibacillus sp. GbtcB18]|uniref:hypothetical protein n=1 Tax=Paenibacillus sp. GbtcB18 TaxID=2824763 RepID=UPI001C2F9189|nr:hypothetical protein [Paenibacillus sp. GbtcB18]
MSSFVNSTAWEVSNPIMPIRKLDDCTLTPPFSFPGLCKPPGQSCCGFQKECRVEERAAGGS